MPAMRPLIFIAACSGSLVTFCVATGASSYSMEIRPGGAQIRHERKRIPIPAGAESLEEDIKVEATNLDPPVSSATGTTTLIVPLDAPCESVMLKAKRLLRFSHSRKQIRGTAAFQFEAEVFECFKSHSTKGATEMCRQMVQAGLSTVTLGAGLQAGSLWTAEDADLLNTHCYPGTGSSSQSLEHHISAKSGEPIVQGDLIVVNSQIQETKFWTNAGGMAYCFPTTTGSTAKIAFEHAIQMFKYQVPCLKFTRIAYDEVSKHCVSQPSVVVASDDLGCYSHLGRVSQSLTSATGFIGSQKVNLGRGCEYTGMAAHQLGHALGLLHMTSHVDRNQYISFSGSANLDYMIPSNLSTPSHSFDYLSLMNQAPSAFTAKNTAQLTEYLGQRMGPSFNDAELLGKIYGCDANPAQPHTKELSTKLLSGQGVGLANTGPGADGACVDNALTGVDSLSATNTTENVTCPFMEEQCSNLNLKERLHQVCPATCYVCIPPPTALLPDKTSTMTSGVSRSTIASVCEDSIHTGIKFNSGKAATCKELSNYCAHATLGQEVKHACKVTCGVCIPGAVSSAACVDQPAEASPQFTLHGALATCAEVVIFCNGHAISKQVQTKCPNSCSLCSTATDTTTTLDLGQWTKPEPNMTDGDDGAWGLGCQRRRRWGFCYTRRRRMH